MNTYRKLLAKELENHSSYYDYGCYPFSWNVGLYYVESDLDTLFEQGCKDNGQPLPPLTGLAKDWDAETQFRWAQEDACRALFEDDCYRSPGRDSAIRFGLSYEKFPVKVRRKPEGAMCYYPAKLDGWIKSDPFHDLSVQAEFSLRGRMGKNLTLDSFEGRNMRGLDAEKLMTEDPSSYTNEWCQKLLAMLHYWDQVFTPRAASKEVQYSLAQQVFNDQYERTENWREALKAARLLRPRPQPKLF